MRFETPPIPEKAPTESRFGNKEHICEVLEHPEKIEIIGSIDELFKDTTSSHVNVVDIAKVKSEGTSDARALHIAGEGEDFYAVYKPFKGEDIGIKDFIGLQRLYPREVLAYKLSEHLGLDLVPPTVYSEHALNQEGSLQLFMDHMRYGTYEHTSLEMSDEQYDMLEESRDFQALAVLDYLLLNYDRHAGNFLVKAPYSLEKRRYNPHFTKPEEVELIAIDNGSTLSHKAYRRARQLGGPQFALSGTRQEHRHDAEAFTPKQTPIPEWLIETLESGLKRHTELAFDDRADEITEDDIAWMWQRAAMLIEKGTFLSKVNAHSISESSVERAADYGVVSREPHPSMWAANQVY